MVKIGQVSKYTGRKEEFTMWAYESVFYQIYPLGFVGAPFENDGVETHRILKVLDWTDHIKKLGANAIYFSPVFESDTMDIIQETIVKSTASRFE